MRFHRYSELKFTNLGLFVSVINKIIVLHTHRHSLFLGILQCLVCPLRQITLDLVLDQPKHELLLRHIVVLQVILDFLEQFLRNLKRQSYEIRLGSFFACKKIPVIS